MKTQLPHTKVFCVYFATHGDSDIDIIQCVWYNYVDGEYIMG